MAMFLVPAMAGSLALVGCQATGAETNTGNLATGACPVRGEQPPLKARYAKRNAIVSDVKKDQRDIERSRQMAGQPEEVRYHMLRPGQIVARRRACPVVYIPLGNLEWHGEHNAVGADSLQAEGIAIRAAQLGGGLVFPPLYYGENRSEGLMEATAPDRRQIAERMHLSVENFGPDRMPFSAMEQALNYQRLLLHILHEAETLGFRVAVLVAGHYPLIDHARAAALLFNQRNQTRRGDGTLAWACADFLLLEKAYPQAGDHAAGWETSHMLALHPGTVDLSLLPPKGEKLVGVGGKMPPQDATASFGQETIDAAAKVMVCEAQHRLDHPKAYRKHGRTLQEGLWLQEGATTQKAGGPQ
jgi:creatinine amidohydrolase